MRSRGFTTLELLVVIAATAILSAIVSVPLSLLQTQQGLNVSVSDVTGVLRRANVQAMAGYYGSDWSVHVSAANGCALPATRIWLYRGNAAFDSATDTADVFDLPNGSHISAVSLGGGCDVKFSRFHGSTTSTGTVTISDRNGNARTVSINAYGRIVSP